MDPRRLDALLAHAAGEGPEATNARKLLARLAEEEPGMAWVLDPAATGAGEELVDLPTPTHRAILERLAGDQGCTLDPFETPCGWRWRLAGRGRSIQTALAAYQRHADRLALLGDLVGAAYLQALNAPDEDEEDVPVVEDAAASDEADEAEAPVHPVDAQETERSSRLAKVAEGLPTGRLAESSRRLVAGLFPEEAVAVTLLGGKTVRWDDPGLTFEEFLGMVRAWRPRLQESDAELLVRFRAGERLYPPTRRFRRVVALERPWGTPLP
jgi:hypothetical protein